MAPSTAGNGMRFHRLRYLTSESCRNRSARNSKDPPSLPRGPNLLGGEELTQLMKAFTSPASNPSCIDVPNIGVLPPSQSCALSVEASGKK